MPSGALMKPIMTPAAHKALVNIAHVVKNQRVSTGGAAGARREHHQVHLITLAALEQSLYLSFGSPVRMRLGGVEDGGRSMSMTHLHPALEAYAHAISMIDAVTGHQPSPLDGEHSSETEATPKQKHGERNAKTPRIENE